MLDPGTAKTGGNQGLGVLTGENAIKHIISFNFNYLLFPTAFLFCFGLLDLDP